MSLETKPENREYFRRHVPVYASATYWRDDEDVLTRRYFTDSHASLLVLGCGGGRVLPPLVKRGFKITAIDIEPEMVAAAKTKCGDNGIQFSTQDAAHLDFSDRSFKYIFFPFHGIDYVEPDIYAAVREAARLLEEDGVFIFNSHNRFYLKKLHRVFSGTHDVYEGLITYRTTPMDIIKLRRFFTDVHAIPRISLLQKEHTNFKDRCYRLLPWLNKSTYFVCRGPRRL